MLVLTVLLVVLAGALLVVGLATTSTVAFLVAAVVSAGAFALLWRTTSTSRERTFISYPPPKVEPEWDTKLVEPEPADDDFSRDLLPVAIDNYSDLVASEILPSLETLSIEQLEAVIARERSGLQRQGIISRAERLIDLTRGDVDLREQLLESATAELSRRSRRKDTPDLGL